MHCGVRDSSVDITQLARRYKIDDKMIITSATVGIQRVPPEKLNVIYNACDVGVNTSMGEGWGLVNVEHAATGAVQIVPRHSACEELFYDCGILVENVSDFMFDNSQTVGKLTSPEEVARALEILYKNRKLLSDLSAKSIKKFTAPEYQWHTIAMKWKDIFMEIFNDSENSPTTINS
jgi:glycosyltransferase involved in cell wall biosynthesis